MKPEQFKSQRAGKVIKVSDKGYWAFVPNPLPPELHYTEEIAHVLAEANRRLGNLNGIGTLLPNPQLLIVPYSRREAVLSSRIEGTQASLSDLFYFEASSKEEQKKESQKSDVLEVFNYVQALNYGIQKLRILPLCVRLMNEMHSILMKGVRGEHLTPGEFRRSQNWIGPAGCTLSDAMFVPPPVREMKQTMSDLEKFLHVREGMQGLIQCALVHYQFEAVHPYLDGNGRIGRLLITLFLCERQFLAYPMLYLSAFFEKHRTEYYERLLAVSQKGEWEEWVLFFLRAVAVQSEEAEKNSKGILHLLEMYRKRVQEKRTSVYAVKLLERLFINPFISIPRAAKELKTSFPTAKAAIEKLEEAKILFRTSDKQRGKIYCARELLVLLEGKKDVNS